LFLASWRKCWQGVVGRLDEGDDLRRPIMGSRLGRPWELEVVLLQG
jgi:hypothetical protein